MIKAAGFIDVGILASVIYKKGVHEPWMCILIYSRMSGKAQRPNRHLATQFLPLIKDVTAREICAQHSAGRFSEIVLVLIECVGLSPGYQLAVALNETHLTHKDIRQLAMLLPKRKAALPQATHGQRICWELLRALDKGISRERDSEVERDIKKNGLARFTQEPDKGEEIHNEIAVKVNEQVAVRATNEIIRHGPE